MKLLTINGSQFRLSTPSELADAKSALTKVALSGGGFVDFHIDGSRLVSILITPTSSVSVEDEPEFVSIAPQQDRPEDLTWLDEL